MDQNVRSESELQEESKGTEQPKKKDRASSQKSKKAPSKAMQEFDEMTSQLEQLKSGEEKLRVLLDFMKAAIASKTVLHLSNFWKARALCLPIFKENLTAANRSTLWSEYLELMKEAQHLKATLEEESTFAVEQIDLAILSLEENLEQFDELLKTTPQIPYPSFADQELQQKKGQYQEWQQEISLLNTLASRVHALRKEVINTGMRLRYKNKFFERLSICGDKIFPKRRQLIEAMSKAFVADVKAFVESYFKEGSQAAPNYQLREEIKAFQSLAKTLTIDTDAFSRARKELSSCWDVVKERDKERKKEFNEKRELFKKHYEEAQSKIDAFAAYCAQDDARFEDVDKQANEILSWMRTVELSREDVQSLKKAIYQAQAPINEKIEKVEAEKKKKKQEKRDKIQQEQQAVFDDLNQTVDSLSSLSAEALQQKCQELFPKVEQLELAGMLLHRTQSRLRQIEEALLDKLDQICFQAKESASLVESLEEQLEKREQFQAVVKGQVDELKKILGGSGFGFEEALELGELLEEEKERMERLNQSIERIEETLDEQGE